MKIKILLLIFLAIVAVATTILTKGKLDRVCFQNHCFNVELAKTAEEKSRGLMFRKNLDSNKGMLFVFKKEGDYAFWMKNTLIPLDIIWINENKEAVFISQNTPPCPEESPCLYIIPNKNAKYVLEINGGAAEKIGLKIGDKMTFRFLGK